MWNKLPNTVIAVTLLLTFGFMAQSDEQPALARFDEVEFVDVPDEFAHMANWAVDLFDEAGLGLPQPLLDVGRHELERGEGLACAARLLALVVGRMVALRRRRSGDC